jgi:AAA+ superfamily predicted ATPase
MSYLDNEIESSIHFIKDCLIDISNNLIQLHKYKIYENSTIGYTFIFDEIKKIKDLIEQNKDLNEIKKSLIECLKYICIQDIRMALFILYGYSWGNYLNIEDMSQISLIAPYFNCISVWNSSFHEHEHDNAHAHEHAFINKDDASNNKKRIPNNKKNIIKLIDSSNKDNHLILGDFNAFPMFIKSLSDFILIDKKTQERKYNFNYNEINKLFKTDSNILFIKNDYTNSLIEEKNGMNIIIRLKGLDHTKVDLLVIQGIIKDDMLELYKTNNFISNKYKLINDYIEYQINTVPKFYKMNCINILNLRDILINSNEEIGNKIKYRYNEYRYLKTLSVNTVLNDFIIASNYKKMDMILSCLCGDNNDAKLGYLMYDLLKMKDNNFMEIYNLFPLCFKVKLDETEQIISKEDSSLIKNYIGELSYERRINMLDVPDYIKDKAIEKLKSMKTLQGDNKAASWLDGFLKLPFGIFCENKIINFKNNFIKKISNDTNQQLFSCDQITKYIEFNHNNINNNDINQEWSNYNIEKSKYLQNIHKSLDDAVYGHNDAKIQLERLFAQWINGETKGAIIGLHGPPGTGKTSLAKNGLSKCLIDDNNKPRPFAFLPIGGSVNGSTLVGHNFTYVGSTWGRIADILMTTQCMNPIIFIDEVDKISSTEYGREIVSVLTHLTDSTQNDNFEDKYFSGIPLDLSKALIVFSFNDISLLDPILRDRITIIETKAYTLNEKIQIINDYMLPQILKEIGFDKSEINIDTSIVKYLIDTFTNEAGVRKIKEKLVDIIRDINLKYIHDQNKKNFKLPFTITKEYIDELFRNKPKIKINMIHKNPEIGLVNGLYATTTGIGGLTPIQVMKYPSDKMLDLTLTGQQGDIMKESMNYALRIAYNMLTEEEQNKILTDASNKKTFGLLIHTPEAATKKDGPSAGIAISLAIYSVLTGKKIKNNVAMTGEIDLCKNARAIGGVYAKLMGAKASGVTLALIPKENEEDLQILRNENNSPEDENFKVVLIDCFEDAIFNAID